MHCPDPAVRGVRSLGNLPISALVPLPGRCEVVVNARLTAVTGSADVGVVNAALLKGVERSWGMTPGRVGTAARFRV